MSSALDSLTDPRWVCWKRTAEGRCSAPLNPHTGLNGSATDPRTWGTRAQAEAATNLNGSTGVGYVLGDLGTGMSVGGTDFDTCIAGDELEPWAQDGMRVLNSYTEKSQSETGFKTFFFCRTEVLDALREAGLIQNGHSGVKFTFGTGKHPPGIELYLDGRYFAVTSKIAKAYPNKIREVSFDDLKKLIGIAKDALNSGGSDKSRSAAAMRIGGRCRRNGATFEEMCEAIRTDPETADWYLEKGIKRDNYELKRIWEKADRSYAAPGADGPLPLFPKPEAPLPYPVDALGPCLSGAVKAIAGIVHVDVVMAAQSILSGASLAACSHADVLLPFGERQVRPLALYMATVAASGDHKSSSDNEALWPITKHEKNLIAIYEEETETWRRKHAAWAAQKRVVETDRKITTLHDREEAVNLLGPEPPRPLVPALRTGDITVEGLTKKWPGMLPALGVFTAEGGTFTASHAMNTDNRVKTAAMLSGIWDGTINVRIRATDNEAVILLGRRLVFHLMIQPDVAAEFLGNATLRDQGFLSRFLVAEPTSLAGTVGPRKRPPAAETAIKAYGARILSLLEHPAQMRPGKRNELDPRVLQLEPKAEGLWFDFHENVERQRGPDEDLHVIKDIAAKAAEQAARIAGVLTIVEDIAATKIERPAIERGIRLSEWYIHEAVRLRSAGRMDQKLLHAAKLLEWLKKRPEKKEELRTIMQFGPEHSRLKDDVEAHLGILKTHGLVREISERPRVFMATGP